MPTTSLSPRIPYVTFSVIAQRLPVASILEVYELNVFNPERPDLGLGCLYTATKMMERRKSYLDATLSCSPQLEILYKGLIIRSKYRRFANILSRVILSY